MTMEQTNQATTWAAVICRCGSVLEVMPQEEVTEEVMDKCKDKEYLLFKGALNRPEEEECECWQGSTHSADEITCPHCLYEYGDSWDYTADQDELECKSCGNPFNYYREVTVTYTTYLIEEDEKQSKVS